jgi:hypothetical protein
MSNTYLMLVASLPALPYFERAERLTLTEWAMSQRLKMLEERDATELHKTLELLRWPRQTIPEHARHINAKYRRVIETIGNPGLREFVEWQFGHRAALAALRLKALGHGTPPEQPWGAGRLVRPITKQWAKPEVGANALYPWLKQAHTHLETGDVLALERLLMAVTWRRATILSEIDPFGFEAVAGYVFKWRILQYWVGFSTEKSALIYRHLIEESIREHQLTCN